VIVETLAALALAPTRIQVTAKEFYFVLSRQTVKAGPAIVELVNFGEDAHDLRLQRLGSRHIAGTREAQPGTYVDLNLRLVRGRYRIWCSIANHRQLGMVATFTVR
jgi:plastocyanin